MAKLKMAITFILMLGILLLSQLKYMAELPELKLKWVACGTSAVTIRGFLGRLIGDNRLETQKDLV